MSGDSLSQEEIDALLKGAAAAEPEASAAEAETAAAESEAAAVAEATPDAGQGEHVDPPADDAEYAEMLTFEERDTLGEIGNICMASAATTLSMLLGHQVVITTPRVSVTRESAVIAQYQRPAALVRIRYTEGLTGMNVFVISTEDASIVADLMMGGAGTASSAALDEIQISAVGEAMNQMMGAAATSMANLLSRRVDISAPEVGTLDPNDGTATLDIVGHDEPIVAAAFDLIVGDLLQTTLMQLMPLDFARGLVDGLMAISEPPPAAEPAPPAPAAPAAADPAPAQAAAPSPAPAPAPAPVPAAPAPVALPAAFQSLGDPPPSAAPGDIGLLLDVPLQVSVELGRTELRIRNVLELVPGSIIELDRLAGEPVDVLVNGKQIARGEVVVIDEEFGIRITDIASQATRLRGLAD